MPVFLYDATQLHPDDILGILTSENCLYGYVNNFPIRRLAVPYESIDLFAGNDRTFRVYVKTPELNIVDLTGATGVLTIKTDKDSSVKVVEKSTAVSGEGQIGSADEGEMFFYLIPSDTSSLAIRQYVYDFKVTLSNGKTYTVAEGVINLNKSVG